MRLGSPCLPLGILVCVRQTRGLRRIDLSVPVSFSGANGSALQEKPRPLEHPTLVIAGIGGSGTTAVTKALEHLGLGHCSQRDRWEESPWSHDPDGADGDLQREFVIRTLLEVSGHLMTEAAYRRGGTTFDLAVKWMGRAADEEARCIERERMTEPNASGTSARMSWGFKEPHYAYLLPAMDVAYENRTNYLLIARDPRDSCHSYKMDQFLAYGDGDCYKWWEEFWTSILDAFEGEVRLRILCIEDLVIPDPLQGGSSMKALQCALDHAGLMPDAASARAVLEELGNSVAASLAMSRQPRPPAEDAMRELRDFHDHRGRYAGNKFLDSQQGPLEADLASRSEIHPVMRRLGYNPTHWGRVRPRSSSVCRS